MRYRFRESGLILSQALLYAFLKNPRKGRHFTRFKKRQNTFFYLGVMIELQLLRWIVNKPHSARFSIFTVTQKYISRLTAYLKFKTAFWPFLATRPAKNHAFFTLTSQPSAQKIAPMGGLICAQYRDKTYLYLS